MKTFLVRLAVLAALAAVIPASTLIAQGAQPPSLSEAEVRQLIVRGEPADHARLSAHFTAQAQRYAADAKRHESMGQAFSSNTKLAPIAPSQREHCKQLSARDLESASTLRELAAYHMKQAAGVPSEPPKGSERSERGAGASVPSDAELTRLAATAETPADHRALDGYFTTLADRYEREAKESTTYAASWRSLSSRNPSASTLAENWDRLARQQRAAATEARAAAAMHKGQATAVR